MSMRVSGAWASMMAVIAVGVAGCTSGHYRPPPPEQREDAAVVRASARPRTAGHPEVRIEGIDGTVFRGELMNASVTVDSGQGSLTLLTDHVHDILISPEFDTVRSDAVEVSGTIKEQVFLLRSDHGVFNLHKERLRKIEFIGSPAPAPATRPGTATTPPSTPATTVRTQPLTTTRPSRQP